MTSVHYLIEGGDGETYCGQTLEGVELAATIAAYAEGASGLDVCDGCASAPNPKPDRAPLGLEVVGLLLEPHLVEKLDELAVAGIRKLDSRGRDDLRRFAAKGGWGEIHIARGLLLANVLEGLE